MVLLLRTGTAVTKIFWLGAKKRFLRLGAEKFFLGLGAEKLFFVTNEFNCIKIDNKAIFLLQ
jgi:hypothetical protein